MNQWYVRIRYLDGHHAERVWSERVKVDSAEAAKLLAERALHQGRDEVLVSINADVSPIELGSETSTASDDDPFIGDGPDHAPDGTRLRQGGCTCGAVRFEVRGEPVKVGLCHCAKCRKSTGSAFLAYADWPTAEFTHTGDFRDFQGRCFCPICGSQLFHLSEQFVEINLGALDTVPSDLVPTEASWIGRREDWLMPVNGAVQFDRDTDYAAPPRNSQLSAS